ncbi:MAG: hypothetical protein V2I57_09580 [Xanthomonadales bacterium]|jgi:hypothetical protein|nr:hypothetical protein [Xanthomonadales bacterium]
MNRPQLWAILSLLILPIGACLAEAETAWFSTEGNALHALSDGAVLPVLECDRCDADDPLHRTTAETLEQVLREFRANGLPGAGHFVLRERVAPRYTTGETLLQHGAFDCSALAWTPSLTLWRYDLASGEAEPRFTACVPFLDPEMTLRLSCTDCDLDRLQAMTPVVEGLRDSFETWHESDTGHVRVLSGEVLVTDPSDRGFRRVDFRAYGSRVYLGPDQGRTEVVTLGLDAGRALVEGSAE